ncbi:MAG: glycosyltransferase [Clostridia bacterium]|nr:glycosyltransferase [Clostridia bacterium]
MPKVSIIVPVYNTENYVEKCLQSLAKQTMQDFEIIVVNDGSTDNSETTIKKFIEEHQTLNITYLRKENGGLASARNYGMKYAKGKYLSFIDSDDYIEENLYKDLEKYMEEEIDIIKFKMQTVDENGKIIEKLGGPVFEKTTGEEAYKKLCTFDLFIDPACIYLYKREFFMENNFQYELRYHEDFGLTSLIIIQAKSFVSTDKYGYYYLQTTNSLTRQKDYKTDIERAKDVLKHYDNMLQKLKNYQIQEETKKIVKRYYTNGVLLKTNSLKGEELNNYCKEIKKRKLYKNINPENLKQLVKRILLKLNVKLYLKMR